MPKERLIIPTFSGGFVGRSAFGNPGDGANIQPIETRKANNYIFDRVRSVVPYPRLVEDLTVFDDMATDLIANQSLLYMPSDYNLDGVRTENSRYLIANSASGIELIPNPSLLGVTDWTLDSNVTAQNGDGGTTYFSADDDITEGFAKTDLNKELEYDAGDPITYICKMRVKGSTLPIEPYTVKIYLGTAAEAWTSAIYTYNLYDTGLQPQQIPWVDVTFFFQAPSAGYVKLRVGLKGSSIDSINLQKYVGIVRFYDIDSAGASYSDFDVPAKAGFMFNIDGAMRINRFVDSDTDNAKFFSNKFMWQDFTYFKKLPSSYPVFGLKQYTGDLGKPAGVTVSKGVDPEKVTVTFPPSELENKTMVNVRTPGDDSLADYDNTIPKGENFTGGGDTTGVKFFTLADTNFNAGIKRVKVKIAFFSGYKQSSDETGVNFSIYARMGETTDQSANTGYLASNYQRDSKLSVYIPIPDVTRNYEFDFPLSSLLTIGGGNFLGVSLVVEDVWWGAGVANNYWGVWVTSIEIETLDLIETITIAEPGMNIKVGSMSGYSETIWADKEYKFAGCWYYENGQASPLEEFAIDTGFTATGPLYALLAVKEPWNISDRIRGFGFYIREKERDEYNKWIDMDFQTGDATIWPMNKKELMYYDLSDDNYKLEYYPDDDSAVPFETFYTTYGINPELSSFNMSYHRAVFTNRKVYAANVKIPTLTDDLVIDMDGVYYSLVNKPDMFSIENRLDIVKNDGDKVVQLIEYADRLLVFKTTKTFIINISKEYEFLEEELTDNGIAGVANVVRTKEGVFWVNDNGFYKYDGRRTNELLLREDGSRKIPVGEWRSLMINPTDGAVWQGLYYMPGKRILMWHGSPVSAGPVDAFGATAPEMVFYHIDFDSITYASGFFTDPPGGGLISLPDSYMSKIVYVPDNQKHYFIVEQAVTNDPSLWHIDENVGTDLATADFDLDTKIFRLAEQGQKRFNLYSVNVWLDLSTSAEVDITITTDKGVIGPFTYVAPNNDLNEAIYDVSAEANARGITEVSFKINNMSNFTGVDGFPKSRYVEKAYIIYRKIGRGAE